MVINYSENEETAPVNEAKLREIAGMILNDYYEEIPDFSLNFVSPEEIRELNRSYRDTDAVTDVLSFESGGEIDPETGNEYLGDIIICTEQAKRQAEQSGHPLENEVILLEIHGLLHLLGYDHLDEEQKAEMWKYQDLYLEKSGTRLNRKPGEDFDF